MHFHPVRLTAALMTGVACAALATPASAQSETDAVAEIAADVNRSVENIGARRLHTVLERLLAERDWMRAPLPPGRRLWRIPTAFGGADGPQLEDALGDEETEEPDLDEADSPDDADEKKVATVRMTYGAGPGIQELYRQWIVDGERAPAPVVEGAGEAAS